MNKQNKMTNVTALTIAIETLSADPNFAEVVEKLTNIKASQVKRATTKSEKDEEKDKANKDLQIAMLDHLADGHMETISEMLKSVKAFEGLSNQKVTSVAKALVDTNLLYRGMVKRKAYFSINPITVEKTEETAEVSKVDGE